MNTNAVKLADDLSAQQKPRALQRLKARRKLWLTVHLWLGLVLGGLLAVIGVTGSVLVFHHELDTLLNPALYYAAQPNAAVRKPLDEAIAIAEQAAPEGWNSAWLNAPEPDGNYVFGFYYPDASPPPYQAESLNIAIDPYTGAVVGQRVFYHAWNPVKHSLIGFFFKLHYALLLGATGVTLVGIIAVLLVISVLTGLILWWPLTGNWRRVLTIKRNASSERFNHDLHQTTGFYSLLVMLAVLISGIYFNLPEQFSWLVERFSPLTPEPKPGLTAPPAVASGALERGLQHVLREHPGGVPQFYAFAPGNTAVFTACYRNVPDLKPYVLDSRCFQLERASGRLLAIKDPAHGTGGDVFMQWQWPLHSGQAFGWTGRILVLIAGLICPVLFVTGVIRWMQKRRAGRHRRQALGA